MKIKVDICRVALVLLFLAGANFLARPASAASDPTAKPYQAIVKINTYVLDKYSNLSLSGSGSGIIIDPAGLVLTNYHVTTIEEEFDGSLRETSFQICLTADPNRDPDCSYIGRMVSRDKDLDVAVLKLIPIEPLAAIKEAQFPYLELDRSNSIATGSKINVFGYPSIGQETITNTEGIVSGKINKYKKDWIKTDAVVSFGNSGGAGISKDGLVVGLTSQAHYDLAGNLGYLISISSLSKWIDEHLKWSAQVAGFEDKLKQFSIKQKEIKKSDTFKNERPPYSVVKPSNWDFKYSSEDALEIEKKDDDEGGAVAITTTFFPMRASTDLYATMYKRMLSQAGYLGLLGDAKNTPVNINGLAGVKSVISVAGETQAIYVFAIGNYTVTVSYNYGRLDKDKVVIDGIINSLRPAGSVLFESPVTYESSSPVMSLVSNEKWPVIDLNSKDERAELYNEVLPNAFIALELVKIDAKEKDLTNEDKLKLLEDQATAINNAGSALGIRYAIADSSAHFKLNDEIDNVIMIVTKKNKIENDKLLLMMADHYYKQDDYYIDISFNMFTDSQSDFDEALEQVKPILVSLSLKPLSENPTALALATKRAEEEKEVAALAQAEQVATSAPSQAETPAAVQMSKEASQNSLFKSPIFLIIAGVWILAIILVVILLIFNIRRR